MGVRVARAMALVRAPALVSVTLTDFYRDTPSHGLEIPDQQWIRDSSAEGWLALTQDQMIVERQRERQAIVEHGAGVVILRPGDAVNYDVLSFVVRRMDWLRAIDQEARPFVYKISLRGRPRRVPLTNHTGPHSS